MLIATELFLYTTVRGKPSGLSKLTQLVALAANDVLISGQQVALRMAKNTPVDLSEHTGPRLS